jgi:AcrR family transcriptional regulator
MTGLRARQKADKNQRILENASELFREVGYDHARIEDIAERAEVSVGTFYNYYQTKGDVLLATVAMEVEEVLANGEAIVNDPPKSVSAALNALASAYCNHSLYYLTKEMWRVALGISIQQPDSHFAKIYTKLDQRLSQQVAQLIASLQRRGLVRSDVEAGAIGQMVFNNLNMMFIEFVKDEAMSLEALNAQIYWQNAPLARLIVPLKMV